MAFLSALGLPRRAPLLCYILLSDGLEGSMGTRTCHRGAVKVSIPEQPAWVTDCNCSICRHSATVQSYMDFIR